MFMELVLLEMFCLRIALLGQFVKKGLIVQEVVSNVSQGNTVMLQQIV